MSTAEAHVPATAHRTTNVVNPASRDIALDFVKGILVVIMVIYHAMNVFSTAGAEAYSYIRFVSGSFILLSGYIVASFSRQSFESAPGPTARRLAYRGLKLVVLFTVLNMLIWTTGVGNPDKSALHSTSLPRALVDIFVVGKAGIASFQILLPIAYVLIAAPLFLALRRHAVVILVSGVVATAVLEAADPNSVNAGFAVLGAIGLAGGMLALPRAVPGTPKAWQATAGLAACMAAMRYLSIHFTTYTLGTIAVLKFLYDLGNRLLPANPVRRAAVLLGQYSLFGYVGQIVLLQLASTAMARPRWSLGAEVAAAVLVTIVVLILASLVLTFLRNRSAVVDRAYRLVFA